MEKHTALLDSTDTGHISELLVNIVCSSSAVVTQENTIVPCLQSTGGVDGFNSNDLTMGPLDLLMFGHEHPESALCNNMVLGKNSHSVNGGLRVGLSGEGASNHHKLL